MLNAFVKTTKPVYLYDAEDNVVCKGELNLTNQYYTC